MASNIDRNRAYDSRNKLADLEKWLSGDSNVADLQSYRLGAPSGNVDKTTARDYSSSLSPDIHVVSKSGYTSSNINTQKSYSSQLPSQSQLRFQSATRDADAAYDRSSSTNYRLPSFSSSDSDVDIDVVEATPLNNRRHPAQSSAPSLSQAKKTNLNDNMSSVPSLPERRYPSPLMDDYSEKSMIDDSRHGSNSVRPSSAPVMHRPSSTVDPVAEVDLWLIAERIRSELISCVNSPSPLDSDDDISNMVAFAEAFNRLFYLKDQVDDHDNSLAIALKGLQAESSFYLSKLRDVEEYLVTQTSHASLPLCEALEDVLYREEAGYFLTDRMK